MRAMVVLMKQNTISYNTATTATNTNNSNGKNSIW